MEGVPTPSPIKLPYGLVCRKFSRLILHEGRSTQVSPLAGNPGVIKKASWNSQEEHGSRQYSFMASASAPAFMFFL